MTKRLDNSNSAFQIHYDEATSLLFVANKRDNYCDYYYYHDGGDKNVLTANETGLPQLIHLSDFETPDKETFLGLGFLPMRCNNPQENEITRSFILYGKSAEFISFKLPKRYGMVDELEVYENKQVEFATWEGGLVPKDRVYNDYVKQREILEA
jgi:hypothetical protein